MQFTVDNRETACLAYLGNHSNQFDVKPLDIGDFVFSDEDGVIRFLFERKTLGDMVASVKDGRYSEQKSRLLGYRAEHPSVYLAYILESSEYSFLPDFTYRNGSVTNKTMTGMLINTSLRDGIFIWFTRNVQETCELLLNIHRRLVESPEKYLKIDSKNYESNAGKINVKKKINNDTRFCFISQLACIPGISNKKAIMIIDTLNVSSMKELVGAIQADTSCLSKINGIGDKLDNVVKQYLGIS